MGNKKNLKKISILTLNTLGTPFFAPYITKRYRKTAQLINEMDIDVICLQEIFTYYHYFLFQKTLTKFNYTLYQKNPFGPRGGLVIFSKLPLIDSSFMPFSYPKKGHVPLYTRIAQHGILSARLEPFSIRIATTHFSSDNDHNLTPKNKLYSLIQHQSDETAVWVNESKKNNSSLILTGDLNIAKNSQLYEAFLTKTNLSDVFSEYETPTYYPDRVSYFYQAPADRCDFIFIYPSHKNTITQTQQLLEQREYLSNGEKYYLSDHIALHCILAVNE